MNHKVILFLLNISLVLGARYSRFKPKTRTFHHHFGGGGGFGGSSGFGGYGGGSGGSEFFYVANLGTIFGKYEQMKNANKALES